GRLHAGRHGTREQANRGAAARERAQVSTAVRNQPRADVRVRLRDAAYPGGERGGERALRVFGGRVPGPHYPRPPARRGARPTGAGVGAPPRRGRRPHGRAPPREGRPPVRGGPGRPTPRVRGPPGPPGAGARRDRSAPPGEPAAPVAKRSEEHTSELQ